MNTEDELLDAILANREDRDAYRVYGDFLEQRGDPRGTLIAMELRADEGGLDPGAIADFLARHPALVPRPTQHRWKWGFVVDATLSSSELANVLAHPSCVALQSLEIQIDDALEVAPVLALLAQPRPTIEKLVVRYGSVDNSLFDGPDGLPDGALACADESLWARLPRLVRLELEGPWAGFPSLIPSLRSNLRELVIHGTPVVDGVWELPAVTRIEWNELEAIDQLAPLWNSPLPALRELRLVGEIWPERFFEHRELMSRVPRLDDLYVCASLQGAETTFHFQHQTLENLRRELRPGEDVREAWKRLSR